MKSFAADWTPADRTTAIWLDATTGVNHTSGEVDSWDDQSGNGRDLSVTGGARPDNGGSIDSKTALNFDGTDDYLRGSGQATWINGTAYMIFAVVKADAATGTDYYMGTNQSGVADKGLHVGWRDLDTYTLAQYSDDTDYNGLTRNTNANLYTTQYKDPDAEMWINGASQGAGSNANPANDLNTDNEFQVGRGYSGGFWDGLIAEVVIVTGAITTAEREQIEGYLAWKWGLEASLPDDHGYRYGKPQKDLEEIWADNFETDKTWTGYGGHGVWERGAPSQVSAYQGLNVIATDLDANTSTSPGGPAYITSPSINCAGYTGVNLSFRRNSKFENVNDFDDFTIWVYDGGTWNKIWTSDNTAVNIDDSEWMLKNFDISAHVDGVSNAQVRFGIETDTGTSFRGWFIDNLVVKGFDNEDYINDWQYLTTFTLNTTSGGANVTTNDVANFPVLLRLTSTEIDFTKVYAGGDDLRFSNSSGDHLPYEIEDWDDGASTAVVWVLVDNVIKNNSTQTFTIHHDNSAKPPRSNPSGVFQTSNGFAGVWHLNGTLADATSNGNDGSLSGDPTATTTSIIADAYDFDGNDKITVTDRPSLDLTDAITISGWMRATTWNQWSAILSKGNDNNYELENNGTDGRFRMRINNEFSGAAEVSGLSLSTWYYLSATYDKVNRRIYEGGVEKDFDALTVAITPNNTDLSIGDRSNSDYFTGQLDEMRVSSVARSAEWVKLSYENQQATQTLVVYDNTNPSVTTLSPTDNSTEVWANLSLVMTFDEAVDAESGGNVIIYKTSGDVLMETIDVTSSQVTGSGSTTITINPSVYLDENTEYYVLVEADAFDDIVGNSYAGIASTTAWSFTTENYTGNWTNSQKLYLNTSATGANVTTGAVTDFPILIRLNSSNFVFADAMTNGEDIRFANSSGKSLPYEIDRWESGTPDSAEVWVLVDNIAADNSTQYITMYWHGSGKTDRSSGSEVFDTQNNHYGAWHLGEAVNTNPNGYADATANAGNGQGTNMALTEKQGIVEMAQDFDGTDDFIDLNNSASSDILPGANASLTVSAWFNPRTIDVGDLSDRVVTIFDGTANSAFILAVGQDDNVTFYNDDGSGGTTPSTATITAGTWVHAAVSYDGTTFRLYVNGEPDATKVDGLNAGASDAPAIGARTATQDLFNGLIDEVRISTTNRSKEWIKLSYQNQRRYQTLVEFEDYSTWASSKVITLNTTAGGANVTTNDVADFPILLRFDATTFNFADAMANGEDIRFATSAGKQLRYEIERWDNSAELAEVWVLMDNVIKNNNTQSLTMYWHGSGKLDNSNPGAVFDTENDFEGVWHLDEASGTFADATLNGNTGSDNVSDAGKTGITGEGQTFDGADDYISITRPVQDDYTIAFWMKAVGNSPTGTHWWSGDGLVDGEVGGTTNDLGVTFVDDKIGHGTGNPDNTIKSSVTVNDAAWHHVAVTRILSSGAKEVFVDGASVGTGTGGTTSLTAPANMRFGSLLPNSNFFDGSMDEIQISSSGRTDEWIKLSYMNQRADDKLTNIPLAKEDYSEWTYNKTIVMNTTATGAAVTGTVNNFPLLVRVVDDVFIDMDQADGGNSIRFSNSSGTHLPYEIERWCTSCAPDSAEIWVLVDQVLGSNATQFITMHWGNALAADSGDGAAVFKTANDYLAVYHLEEDGGSGGNNYLDATDTYNGEGVSMTTSSDVNGIIGRAQTFDGGADYIDLNFEILANRTAFTVTGWIAPDDLTDVSLFGNDNNVEFTLDGSSNLRIWTATTGPITGTYGHSAGEWHMVSITGDGSNTLIYLDGIEIADDPGVVANYGTSTTDASIAAYVPGPATWFTGEMDEVRYSKTNRSANYLKLSYMNQRSDEKLITPQENYATGWTYERNIILNTSESGANVSGDVTDFPVLIRLDEGNFTFSEALAGGADIRFSNSAGDHLHYEIERWCTSCTPDSAEIWVLVDNIIGNDNSQYITMHWGEAGVATTSNPEAVFSIANGFDVTWHLDGLNDATGNSWDLTDNSSADRVGIIGKGRDFDNGETAYTGSAFDPADQGTLNFWYYADNIVSIDRLLGGDDAFEIKFQGTDINSDIFSTGGTFLSSKAPPAGTWNYISTIWNSSTGATTLYINGIQAATSPTIAVEDPDSDVFTLGTRTGSTDYADIVLDEVRISKVERSADWIKLEYMNQRAIDKLTEIEDYSGGDWSGSKAIRLNTSPSGADITGNVTEFPVLIRITDDVEMDMDAADGGNSIRFANAGGNHLSYEIEDWSASTSAAIWVLVDTIYGGHQNQTITMYWGNSNAEARSDGTGVFETENGFAGVWHMAEAAGNVTDATLNRYNGTGGNNVSSTTGHIGTGQDFDGTDDYIEITNFPQATRSALTVSTWASYDVDASIGILIAKQDGANPSASAGFALMRVTAPESEFSLYDADDKEITRSGQFLPEDGSWHYIAGTFGGTQSKVYQNGDSLNVNTTNGSITSTANPLRFGINHTTNNDFDGRLDEVRVESVTRSSEWIKLCYMNQRAVGKLVEFEDYSNWSSSKSIVVNTGTRGANTSADVHEFPLLIRLKDDASINFEDANGGNSIRFANANGSHLSYEIEEWTASLTATIWVNVDTILSGNSSQTITMYWGHANAPSRSDGAGVFETGNNNMGVWHLGEDGNNTADNYKDATAYTNDGTGTSMTATSDVASIIGIGQEMDGAADYITVADENTLDITGNFTLSAWGKADNWTSNPRILDKLGAYDLHNEGSNTYLAATGLTTPSLTVAEPSAGSWHHFAGVWDGTNLIIYHDGINVASVASSGTVTTTANDLGIGMKPGGVLPNDAWDGILDEARVINTDRSADWIKLSYENQKAISWVADAENYSLWENSGTITLNTSATGADVSGAVTDFPVLIRLNGSNFTFAQAEANGEDIRFASASGTHLPYEIERWDASNKVAEIWVNVDNITGDNATQFINMYWGNANATDRSNGDEVFHTANNFAGVWHLGEAANNNTDNYQDATSNGNHGTGNSMSSNLTGIIGTAQNFAGDADYIDITKTANDLTSATTLTLYAWFKTVSTSADYFIAGGTDNTNSEQFRLGIADGMVRSHVGSSTSNTNSSLISDDQWHLAVFALDGSSNRLVYLDGELLTGHTSTNSVTYASIGDVVIGQEWDPGPSASNLFTGDLDEIRISTTVRSADWIKLSYQNQKADDALTDVLSLSSYASSVRLTFNTTSLSLTGDVDNIPMLIRLDGDDINFSLTKSDGSDIQFVDSSGARLYHEVVDWNRGGDTGSVWVRVPRVDNIDGDYITMYYGCASCPAPYAISDSVWMDYTGVWHLSGGETEALDATGGGNTGTYNTVQPFNTGVTSPFAPSFDGSSDYVEVADDASLDITGAFAVSAWINPSELQNEHTRIVSKSNNNANAGLNNGFRFKFIPGDKANFMVANGSSAQNGETNSVLSVDTWTHLLGVYDGSEVAIYVNGTKQTSTGTISGGSMSGTNPLRIGHPSSDVGMLDVYKFNGAINEVWVRNGDVSDDFIKLIYENQKVGSNLIDASALCGPVAVPGLNLWLAPDSGVYEAAGDDAEDQDFVENWSDISGCGDDLWVSEATDKPKWVENAINGNPALLFDGVNDELDTLSAISLTAQEVFAVVMLETGALAFATIISEGEDDDENIRRWDGNENYRGNANSDGNDLINDGTVGTNWINKVSTDDFTYGVPHMVNVRRNSQTTYTELEVGESWTGGARNWKGYIAEIMIYGTTLSDVDRNLVEQYLIRKYGLMPPDNITTLTATTISSGVRLDWTQPVSTYGNVDTVGIWASTSAYPDSSRNGILVGKFDAGETTYDWPQNFPGTWHFTFLTRDSLGKWSNTASSARDTAIVGDGLRKITYKFDASGYLGGAVADFPMLIRFNTNDSAIFDACPTRNGNHLRFYDHDGGTGEDTLSFERELWDNTNYSGAIWVLVPSVAAGRDSITMVYNGCGYDGNSDDAAVFPDANNFVGVYHFDDDMDGASSNDNDATNVGADFIDANIGRGVDFVDANNDEIQLPAGVYNEIDVDGNGSNPDPSAFTISVWLNGDALQPMTGNAFHGNGVSTSQPLVGNVAWTGGTWGDVMFDAGYEWTNRISKNADNQNQVEGQWNYWTFTKSGANLKIFHNGVQWHSGSVAYDSLADIDAISLGNTNWDGSMDEFRVSDVVRGDDWIRLNYETQKPNTDFFDNTTYEQRIYVDAANGNDANSCGAAEDPSNAKLTVNSAMYCDIANYADTVHIVVAPGTYTSDSITHQVGGVDNDQHIMVEALDPNNPPIFNGHNSNEDATLFIWNMVHLRNLAIKANATSTPKMGIETESGSQNISIIGCRIYNGAGVHTRGINQRGNDIIGSMLFANNIMVGVSTDGIRLVAREDVNITNNIIYGPTSKGIWQDNDNANDDITITNNIFVNVTTGTYTDDTDGDIGLIKNNLYHNVVTQNGGVATIDVDDDPVTGDPLFVSTDITSPNGFKLSPGSPAIDAGTTELAPSTTFSAVEPHDHWGTARPVGSAWDIGAYEGTGESGDVLTSEIDTLTIATDGDTIAVSNSHWHIVFENTEGGGIGKLFDGSDLPAMSNNLAGAVSLFDVNVEGTLLSNQTSSPTLVAQNRVHTIVKQQATLGSFAVTNYYNIYASGHIYIQSEITNNSGTSADRDITFNLSVDNGDETDKYHNNENNKGFGYVLTGTRDVFLGVTRDLNNMGNLPDSDLDWAGSNPNDSTVEYTATNYDLGIGEKAEFNFLLYIGEDELDLDKAQTLNSDSYNPSQLSMFTGTHYGESSWQDRQLMQLSMDEGTGSTLQDLSYNGFTGTVTGATYVPGQSGTALDFTGVSDYVTGSTDALLDASNHKTFMLWIKRNGWTGSGSAANFMNKGTSWSFNRAGDKVEFSIGGATTTSVNNAPDGEWFHAAATVYESGVYLYINGILEDHASGPTFSASGTAIRLGYDGNVNNEFDGQLDDARIYNTFMHSEEIQAIYKQSFSAKSGSYKVRANNNNRIITVMNSSAPATRFQPAFEIDNWYGTLNVPKYVYVDGVQMKHLEDFVSVLEPKISDGINMGNKLEIQFNRTFVNEDVDIFIDNDDSTGFMGASALMPTLTVSVTDNDKITLQNFSGSILGEADSKEWYLELDLDAETDPATIDIRSEGFGSFNVWNAAAINPGAAISTATNLAGVYTHSGTSLMYMRLKGQVTNNSIFTGNAGYLSPAEIGHTWNDSSSVRISVTLDQMTLEDNGVETVNATLTYTVYPTGRIFASYKIENVDVDLTNQVFIRMQTRYDALSTTPWSATYVQSDGVWGLMGGGDDYHSIVGAVMSINTAAAGVVTGSSLYEATANQPYNTGGNDAQQARYQVKNGLAQAADDDSEPLVYNFMVDISTDFADSATADSLSKDVRNPGSMVPNGSGTAELNHALDFNGDGFAEGEGAYVYNATNNIAQFTFNLTNNVPQFYPAFRIENWTSGGQPAVVVVNNQEQIRGYTFNSSVSGTDLIIQFNQVWTGNKEVYISHKPGLAVTMSDSDFVAISAVGVDSLKWTTHSEINNLGFRIKRRIKPGQDDITPADTVYKYLFKKMIPGAPGGRSSADLHYVYVDKTAVFGVVYEYILVAYDTHGFTQEFGPKEASPLTPLVTKLYGNYPNPFNPTTTIRFDLATNSKLALNIYNVKGQLIRRLITPDKTIKAGQYRYQWDARNDNGVDVPTGHYILFFVTKDGYKKARKMTLLK